MEISIRTDKHDDDEALDSLLDSLNGNHYVSENAHPQRPGSRPDRMSGAELAVIELVLGTGFKLVELALQIARWIREQKTSSGSLIFTTDGREAELRFDDVDDLDRNFAVRRAIVGAPDPRRSRCVLIGISDYGTLPSLPKVRKNLVRLRETLQSPEVWGISDDRISVVHYPRTADDIIEVVREAAENASDTLLVYFAGHGLHDQHDGLLLALPDADGTGTDQTVLWEDLAGLLDGSSSCQPVVWLDCCYAGLALPDGNGPTDEKESSELLKAARVRGTYILAATTKYGQARAPDGGECTAFTGELVKVLRNGVAPGPPTEEFLSLNAVHQEVSCALTSKTLPQPRWRDPRRIGGLPQFRNSTRKDPEPRPVPDPRRPGLLELLKERISGMGGAWRLAAAVAVALVVIVGLTIYWLTPGPVVSGLDFSKYCSTLAPVGSQRFGVAGDNCVQPISLDAACAYSYPDQSSDLTARLVSDDPYSAVCEGPASSSLNYGGISDMNGYCADHTRVPGVTATAKNSLSVNTWICQVEINKDLACDQQNNQTDLVARQEESQTWLCREKH